MPIGDLFRIDNYSRTSLTRKYIDLKNNILKTNIASPNLIFEEEWSKIEKNNNSKLLLLKDAPFPFAYFMNKGLIVNNLNEISKNHKEITLCYEIDNNQNIFNINCMP